MIHLLLKTPSIAGHGYTEKKAKYDKDMNYVNIPAHTGRNDHLVRAPHPVSYQSMKVSLSTSPWPLAQT